MLLGNPECCSGQPPEACSSDGGGASSDPAETEAGYSHAHSHQQLPVSPGSGRDSTGMAAGGSTRLTPRCSQQPSSAGTTGLHTHTHTGSKVSA